MFSSALRLLVVAAALMFAQLAQASTNAAAKPADIVFLNPGFANEPFWVSYSEFMQAAAKDLGVNLRILYGERQRERILKNAHTLTVGPLQPDYIIFVNEMYVGPEILRIFAETPVKLFSLHSTLTPEQQTLSGGTRERYKNWIGSLIANDQHAGYLMAKALIEKLSGQPGSMLAFNGIRSTPSSALREQGLRQALAEHPEIKLQQTVVGEWSRQRAYEQAKVLLKRHPDAQLAWSANDEMAFGVMDAAQELGRTPGRDIYLSALNNSDNVFKARINNQISALTSGHFSLGAWAVVMLHDYHAGKDFAERGGKDRVDDLFTLVDEKQAAQLMRHMKMPGYGLNFKNFSAVYKPQIKDYQFSIEDMLH
ncbi:ABC transporter substrate-binding protein [Ectopseudomonas mendocina]|uniref:ABC transporter substrate-binding protein n=1 Tax=Ectopseudomonas mendocina TaxID=300 RepID=A0ABZ2RAI4_ECTME